MCDRLSAEPCPNLASSSTIPRYLALASAAALLKYVEHIQATVFEPASMRITLAPNDGTLFLDVATIEAVELIRSAHSAPDGGAAPHAARAPASLLQVVDHTKTRPGKRFLRRTLLEPPSDSGTVTARQEVVEELSANEDAFNALRTALSNFPDLESVLAALLAKEAALVAQFSAPPVRQLPPPSPSPPPSSQLPLPLMSMMSPEEEEEEEGEKRQQETETTENDYDQRRSGLTPRPPSGSYTPSTAALYFQNQQRGRSVGASGSTASAARSAAGSAPSTATRERPRSNWTTGGALASGAASTMSLPSINLIRNVLKVKAAVDSLTPILQVATAGSSVILQAIASSMRSAALQALSKAIAAVIDESAAPSSKTEYMRLQGAFAVRNGLNGHLDVARKTLSENVEDMHEQVRRPERFCAILIHAPLLLHNLAARSDILLRFFFSTSSLAPRI